MAAAQSAPWPPGFIWGAATASYQIEGAYKADGRTLTEWDVWSHTPGKTKDGATGDVADRSYELFEVDNQLLAALGVDHYRFSLSWSRIIKPDGSVNQPGLDHYNALIDSLLAKGIKPYVTLFHWDLPMFLSTMNATSSVPGWLTADIVPHFVHYADVCFKAFGDRVKQWLTLNEPWTVCWLGHGVGVNAPGRCSDRTKCKEGDSGREPYTCAHHMLLAHAEAVQLYRSTYQPTQQGSIGIALNSDFAVPKTDKPEDVAAADRFMQFMYGWYADPVIHGDYPLEMKTRVGPRLPSFTAQQRALLKGSTDFLGLNHYTSQYAQAKTFAEGSGTDSDSSDSEDEGGRKGLTPVLHGWSDDMETVMSYEKDGVPIGEKAASDWLYIVPWGFAPLLHWIGRRYPGYPLVVTENGVDCPDEDILPVQQVLNDTCRVNYYQGYLKGLEQAVYEGVPVQGYFAWSLLDNFEWADGYSKRFGLHYVDYNDGQKRYAKRSANWYRDYIKKQHATVTTASTNAKPFAARVRRWKP